MRAHLPLAALFLSNLATAIPTKQTNQHQQTHNANTDTDTHKYINWRTFTGYGVNLGGWLIQESTIDTAWWKTHAGNASDEWTMCQNLGSQCGPVLEKRYSTWIKTSDIDTLASAGVTILRIPTTYAAWIVLPGSAHYHGQQQAHLRRIAEYAIKRHGMHVVIDIHSLPGGTNGLDIGEAVGHWGWYDNSTALEWSLRAVDAVLEFIVDSDVPWGYTLEPINEPVDNRDFSTFGTPAALSEKGAKWLVKYIRAVINRVERVDRRIPVMIQGSFKPERYWSGFFDGGSNIVFDAHHYYFQYENATSANLGTFVCDDARDTVSDGKFPVFVGEWAIEAGGGNQLALRGESLKAGLSAWAQFTQGSTFWTAKFHSNVSVAGGAGKGVKQDYWSFEEMIQAGYLDGEVLQKDYC
ncbi:hypothetical protein N7499_000248 [Penicillium canescens]|uniref:glucan 1,3-beta-glucosidase n=1 Tax=Penicillium canescens TaxID=5083 RepID=A0AAD6IGH2_PENCN|nr:hypothetical protein N7522_005823 [Penicillium canescens]KAJ6029104.1 hypothetical protein N7444_012091 [Penicillium canescens]KAJ6047536.1 hypothetical protein N7460_003683 [Penicillium canescens]KAJ6100618.1 hypothetical protein N7499_000248 [Penicillium canescens]KAJ6173079.1 hypothetical protein N7485_005891 [Penicillium canescens]